MIHALTFATYAITLDGRAVLPRARAAVVDGHVLLPVRALGNALGADVGYDGRAHTITVQRGAHVATISARGTVRIVRGTAYAPLRTVATAFGLGVGYDARTRTVALDDRAGELTRPVHAAAAPAVRAMPGGGLQPGTYTVTLQPPNGASVHDPYPAITARFAGATSIDPQSLHATLDGRDVSAEAAVVGDQVLLTPRRALSPGRHYVAVSARDVNGTPIAQQWSFDDDFAFVVVPAPTPYPISAIWIDRWVSPRTNAFDVYVQGQPGMTGYVGVDGIGSYFPLQVYSANAYVAHVFVPYGVNQPFARVAARITLPNGTPQTIVLPQTIAIYTPQKPLGTVGYPTPAPTPSYHSAPRFPLSARTLAPLPTPTARTPSPAPARTASPVPRSVFEQPVKATPQSGTMYVPVPARTATPRPTAAPDVERTAAPRRRVPLARPTATPVPPPPPTPTPTPAPK